MKKLFKYEESETIELKQSLGEREEILETISAFSNAHGGTIYVRVTYKSRRDYSCQSIRTPVSAF